MLKKLIIVVLAVLISLSGCEQSSQQEQISVPETVSDEEQSEKIKYLRENFPRIDGSTSLIPLEVAVRAAVFGKPDEEVEKEVYHTTTWDAFSNLLRGKTDVVLTCELSEYQHKMARDAGKEIELVPVAMEGFVFIVNVENPVDSLTQEQLRKIYSGEITNWKELGGNDAEIIAYQRNSDSGSQNFMKIFMGDTPLMDAPFNKRPGTMAGLIDIVAVSDNAENSIGYSVYTYAADMYDGDGKIKFIKVDGVAPSKATMAAGEYPLMGMNYVAFLKSQPSESPARALAEWMTSDDGQLAAAGAGYVTVRDVGFVYEETTPKIFDAVGTGGPCPGKPASYKYEMKEQAEEYEYAVDNIADPALREEVSAFIAEAKAALAADKASLAALVEKRNASTEKDQLEPYTIGMQGYSTYGCDACTVMVSAKNGYLSAAVALGYTCEAMWEYALLYRTETAMWDMFTGERIGVEDLFYDGVDIGSVLSEYLKEKSVEKLNGYDSYPMKKDFSSLEDVGVSFTHDAIYFDFGNPHFADGVRFKLDDLPEGLMVTEQPRDMTECFKENSGLVHKLFRTTERNEVYKYLESRGTLNPLAYTLLNEDAYDTAKQINSAFEEYLNKYYTEDAILGYYESLGYSREDLIKGDIFFFNSWHMTEYGGKYAIFSSGIPGYVELTSAGEYMSIYYPYWKTFVFDIETGEEIGGESLLKGNWKEDLLIESGDSKTYSDYEDLEILAFRSMREYEGEYKINFINLETGDSLFIEVPEGYINW